MNCCCPWLPQALQRGPGKRHAARRPDPQAPCGATVGASAVERLHAVGRMDCLLEVLSFLPWSEVLREASRVAASWHELEQTQALWHRFCAATWEDKVYVSDEAQRLRKAGEPRRAFREAWLDASRDLITLAELTSFTWSTRMKESAGEHFTIEDPWWRGGSARCLQYLPDGTTRLLEKGPGPSCIATGRWRFLDAPGPSEARSGRHVRWRPTEEKGEVPTEFVLRDARNWGFILDSCWHVQTSFSMPKRGANPLLEDAALPTTVETQQLEAHAYNLGLPLPWPRGVRAARQHRGGSAAPRPGEDTEDEDSGEDDVAAYLPDGRRVRLPRAIFISLLHNAVLRES